MTVVDVTGGVLGGCWQVTKAVVKSSFLDSVQLVGQEGRSKIKKYITYYGHQLADKHFPAHFVSC